MFIAYPEPSFKIKKEDLREFIFDPLRKKWLLLTPEEWVRQNFVQYLVQVKEYPAAMIALEKEIWLGELRKRFDVLVYDQQHKPWMMVECKGMDIELTESTLQQLLRYNLSLPVQYLVIVNGKHCYCWERTQSGLIELKEIPGKEKRE